MMTWKIQITEPHSGELGEAVLHEDHGFVFEEYTYEVGHQMDVVVHDTHDPHWHIFTDLDTGHRIKIPPEKYRVLSGGEAGGGAEANAATASAAAAAGSPG